MGCKTSKCPEYADTSLDVSVVSYNSLAKRLVWLQDRKLEDRYEILEIIGKGSIGEVSVVRRKQKNPDKLGSSYHNSSAGKERRYAMKTVYMSQMGKGRFREFENEISVLQQLNHPNIIRLREVFLHNQRIYMIMDLCTGGHLNERSYTEEESCEIIMQILRALIYMHDSIGICHRDLKMENVMLEGTGKPLMVKLIDFGMSQVFSAKDDFENIAGTIYSLAPEVLLGSGYTREADMWSVGVIVFYLLCGEVPFLRGEKDLQNEEMVERLVTGRFEFSNPMWVAVKQHAKTLVVNLLRVTPGYRWSARKALEHCRIWQENLDENEAYEVIQRLVPSSKADSSAVRPNYSRMSSLGSSHKVDRSIAASIQSFAGYGELKKAALLITASQLEKEELYHLKSAFLAIDSNQNGVISLDELRAVLIQHGIDDTEIIRLFSSMDQYRDGMCSYMEFLAATIEAQGFIEEDRLYETFQRLDVDNSNYISRDNLKIVMGPHYPDELLDGMMAEGASNNGKISLESFMALMRPTLRKTTCKNVREFLQEPEIRPPVAPMSPLSEWRSFRDASVAFASIRMGMLHGALAKLSKEAERKESLALGGTQVPPVSPISTTNLKDFSLLRTTKEAFVAKFHLSSVQNTGDLFADINIATEANSEKDILDIKVF